MQLELDPQDIHLLKEMAVLGEVGPKVLDQERRLERLEVEGYVSSVRRDPPGLEARPFLGLPAYNQGAGYRVQTVNRRTPPPKKLSSVIR